MNKFATWINKNTSFTTEKTTGALYLYGKGFYFGKLLYRDSSWHIAPYTAINEAEALDIMRILTMGNTVFKND